MPAGRPVRGSTRASESGSGGKWWRDIDRAPNRKNLRSCFYTAKITQHSGYKSSHLAVIASYECQSSKSEKFPTHSPAESATFQVYQPSRDIGTCLWVSPTTRIRFNMSSPEETTASGRPKRRAAQPPPVGLDIEGRDAATGSCHCCGGMLSRTPESARQCGKCSARYHAYDCGNRRRDAGFTDFDQCPRVSVFPPSIPRVSTRPGPVFYTRIPKHSPSFLYRGLFFSRTIFPDSTDDSTLTDAFLRPDSAPRCACAREDRCSATPGPSATPAERSANTPSAHPPRSTRRMGPERRPKRTKEPPRRTAHRTIDGFPTSTIQCWNPSIQWSSTIQQSETIQPPGEEETARGANGSPPSCASRTRRFARRTRRSDNDWPGAAARRRPCPCPCPNRDESTT